MALQDTVGDEEELYRSLKVGQQCINENGKWRPTSLAFSDRYKKPSVDRAHLKDNRPEESKKSDTDGVVSIFAAQARQMRILDYELDVICDPIKDHENLIDNPAHALIISNRDYENEKHFRKVIESLGQLAEQRGWLIEPTS